MTITPKLPSTLVGRTVVIFGGTSGIDLAAAVRAKTASAKVIVIGANAARAEQTAHECLWHCRACRCIGRYGSAGTWSGAGVGTAEEAGSAAVFLMSNTFMNGAVLNIDGGADLV